MRTRKARAWQVLLATGRGALARPGEGRSDRVWSCAALRMTTDGRPASGEQWPGLLLSGGLGGGKKEVGCFLAFGSLRALLYRHAHQRVARWPRRRWVEERERGREGEALSVLSFFTLHLAAPNFTRCSLPMETACRCRLFSLLLLAKAAAAAAHWHRDDGRAERAARQKDPIL